MVGRWRFIYGFVTAQAEIVFNVLLLTGVDSDTARQFVTAFYSSLAQAAERSHEPLEGKR